MMAITLEKLSPVRVVARAAIASLIILAHVISLASISFHSQQVSSSDLALHNIHFLFLSLSLSPSLLLICMWMRRRENICTFELAFILCNFERLMCTNN